MQRLAAGEPGAAVQQRIIAVPRRAGRGLDDGVKRHVEAVAEDRKGGAAVAVVNGVIAPFAAGHLAAIKLEQLVELAAAEENAPLPAVIGKAGNRRHDPSLPYFPC